MDLDPDSDRYATVLNTLELPVVGDELHHFGWNARSSALCPFAPHPRPKARAPLLGGPQMVEISRDGKRVYFTNSLYSTWATSFTRKKWAAGW